MILYELSRGIAYQRIKHPQAHWYARTLPALLTICAVVILFLLPHPPVLLGKDGLVASSLAVLSTLPGFYFAGLAAVATFNGLNMDAAMPAPAPVVRVRVAGVDEEVDLSRRQFLSYLFAYLVVVSAALCLIALGVAAATPSILAAKFALLSWAHGPLTWALIRGSCIVIYVGLLSSLAVTTLQGIYFLTERIHQP